MQLWLDAASQPGAADLPHPAEVILLPEEAPCPAWADDVRHACSDGRLLDASGQTVGAHVTIDDVEGQQAALGMVGLARDLILTCGDWQMIPLENLVAAAAGSGTRLIAAVDDAAQIQGAAFALQTGVDALLLPAMSGDEGVVIWEVAQEIAAERLAAGGAIEASEEAKQSAEGAIGHAVVTEVESGGVGDRVCVDLTSMLAPGEGILVGSSAAMLALVHGETLESEFVPTRPFRVNAGAVHAYVRMGDGKTRYLSEVGAGDVVAVCDADGNLREATVGRMKVEQRPFLIIRYRDPTSGAVGQTFLQQAETVRLISAKGEAVSVTGISPGLEIKYWSSRGARHIGENVLSGVTER